MSVGAFSDVMGGLQGERPLSAGAPQIAGAQGSQPRLAGASSRPGSAGQPPHLQVRFSCVTGLTHVPLYSC